MDKQQALYDVICEELNKVGETQTTFITKNLALKVFQKTNQVVNHNELCELLNALKASNRIYFDEIFVQMEIKVL